MEQNDDVSQQMLGRSFRVTPEGKSEPRGRTETRSQSSWNSPSLVLEYVKKTQRETMDARTTARVKEVMRGGGGSLAEQVTEDSVTYDGVDKWPEEGIWHIG